MSERRDTILLVGESGVGKTHYGAQLLQRLMKGDGALRMDGAASNLEPFEAALERLNEGRAAEHTATSTYFDSVWPVADREGRCAELVWPDYGGEQIRTMIASRRVPNAWQDRVRAARAWFLLIRLQQKRVSGDIFTRPLTDLRERSVENREIQISDQARLVELLQMLMFSGAVMGQFLEKPRLGILLTCWDELGFDGTPAAALKARLPMLESFVRSNWRTPVVLGLSALGRPLSANECDGEYVSHGPEEFGYFVDERGSRSGDLTAPIHTLLDRPG